jgi:hypothetical protein
MDLKRKEHLKQRNIIATKNCVEGETITRSWIQSNQEAIPCDVIYALRKPEPLDQNRDPYEKNSKRMAELAKDYHESLQTQGINLNKDLRDHCTKEALESLRTKTNLDQKEILKQPRKGGGGTK